MANDIPATPATEDVPVVEPEVRPAAPPVSYFARVGASCMMWMMVVGIGFFIVVMVLWGISNIDKIGQ